MSDKDENRPVWDFKEMSLGNFEVCNQFFSSVEAKWKFTSADTTEEWLEAKTPDGRVVVLPHSWSSVMQFRGRASIPGMFELNYTGERMRKRRDEIKAWEKKNASELALYKRLKTKFE